MRLPLTGVTALPPAINVLLPVLVADAGRARADTLLAIQGVDPDYIRPHLSAIDSALGNASPGMTGLLQLIRQAEDAVSTSRPTVQHQHVISEVVTRAFVEDMPPGGRQVLRYDFASRTATLAGPKGIGFVDNFVPVDSQATERLWQEVENALNPALNAARDGSVLANPSHLETLRRLVALHYVRNPQTLTAHNRAFADAIQEAIARWEAHPELSAEAFRRRYGLDPGNWSGICSLVD